MEGGSDGRRRRKGGGREKTNKKGEEEERKGEGGRNEEEEKHVRERKETGSRAGRRGRYKRERWGRDEGISILLCFVYVMLAFSKGGNLPRALSQEGALYKRPKKFQ